MFSLNLIKHNLFSLFYVLLVLQIVSSEVPSYIKICGRRNPEIDKCITDSMLDVRTYLKRGMPEINLASIEPANIEKISLADLPDFRAYATNCSLAGLTNFTLDHVHLDLKNNVFYVTMVFPRFILDADYTVNAKILVPINTRGPIKGITGKGTAVNVIKFQLIERKGKTHMFFTSANMKLTIDGFKASFKPGHEKEDPLAEAINAVLVSSQKEILESFTPNFEIEMSKKILQISNKFGKKFTFDELFPDRE